MWSSIQHKHREQSSWQPQASEDLHPVQESAGIQHKEQHILSIQPIWLPKYEQISCTFAAWLDKLFLIPREEQQSLAELILKAAL